MHVYKQAFASATVVLALLLGATDGIVLDTKSLHVRRQLGLSNLSPAASEVIMMRGKATGPDTATIAIVMDASAAPAGEANTTLSYTSDTILRMAVSTSMERVLKKANAMFKEVRHILKDDASAYAGSIKATDVTVLPFAFPSGQAAATKVLAEHGADFGAFATHPSQLPAFQQPQFADVSVIPVAIGATVPVYNIPGVPDLILSRATLALIFLGDITFWDDAAIIATNPAASLPHQQIRVVVDSESLMTNAQLTQSFALFHPPFAARVPFAPTPDWCEGFQVSSTPDAFGNSILLCRKPTHNGADMNYTVAVGFSGMELAMKSTSYSIGYTAYSEALYRNLSIAAMLNKQNKVVRISAESMQTAFLSVDEIVEDRWNVTILDPTFSAAWPIASINYFVYRTKTHINNCDVRNLLLDYFQWFHESQEVFDLLTRSGFAVISDFFRAKAIAQVKRNLKCVRGCNGTFSAPCSCLQTPSTCSAVLGTAEIPDTVKIYYDTAQEDVMQVFLEAFRGSSPSFDIVKTDTFTSLAQFFSTPLDKAFYSLPDFHAGIVPDYQLHSLLLSNPALTEEETNFVSIPAFLNPLGILVNLGNGITEVILSPNVLSLIFNGTIQRWDHLEIQRLNPSIISQLPSIPITLVVEAANPVPLLVLDSFLVRYSGCGFTSLAFRTPVASASSGSGSNSSSSQQSLDPATFLTDLVPLLVSAWRSLGVPVLPRNSLTSTIGQVKLKAGALSVTFIGGQSSITTASLLVNNTLFRLAPQDGVEMAQSSLSAQNEINMPIAAYNKYLGYMVPADGYQEQLQEGVWPLFVSHVAVLRRDFTNTANPLNYDVARNTLSFFQYLLGDDIVWKLSRSVDVIMPQYSNSKELMALLNRVRYNNLSILNPEPRCNVEHMNVLIGVCSQATQKRLAQFFWKTRVSGTGTDPVCVGNEGMLFPDQLLSCDYLYAESRLGAGLILVVICSSLICAGLLLWLWRHRKTKVMITSQPLFLYLFIVGAICFIISTLSLLGNNTNGSCKTRPALIGLGFTLMFAPLLMKLLRVDALFNNPKLRKLVITNQVVMVRTAGFLVVDLTILLVWYILGSPEPIVFHEEFPSIPGATIPMKMCDYADSPGFTVFMLWKVLIVMGGVYLAIKTWNVSHEYSEAKFLALALYNALLMGALTTFILVVINIAAPTQVMLLILMCTYVGMTSVLLVVVPKIFGVAKEESATSGNNSLLQGSAATSKNGSSSHKNGTRKRSSNSTEQLPSPAQSEHRHSSIAQVAPEKNSSTSSVRTSVTPISNESSSLRTPRTGSSAQAIASHSSKRQSVDIPSNLPPSSLSKQVAAASPTNLMAGPPTSSRKTGPVTPGT